MDINNIRFNSLLAAANHISNALNVTLGANPAKIPNNVARITDPFHIWSRNAFDGNTVVKTDLDAIVMNANHTMISSIVESKRSQKIRVGSWLPFFDDEPNYLLTMDLCNKLNVRLITFHHEELSNNAAINPLSNIDVFTYHPGQVSPVNQTFRNFRQTRNITNVRNFIPTL